MAEEWADRMARLIEPLRVKPGSTVTLEKDYDPGYKDHFVRKKDAHEFLRTGVRMLADFSRAAGRGGHAGRPGHLAGQDRCWR